jgi:hypothetical protein
MRGDGNAVQAERLAELVAQLTGEDVIDSAEATAARMTPRPRGRDEALGVVAQAIIDLRESSRALRVTRYLDADFEPVIDLRDGDRGPDSSDDEIEARFRRHGRASGSRPSRRWDRPAGSSTTGFVPA